MDFGSKCVLLRVRVLRPRSSRGVQFSDDHLPRGGGVDFQCTDFEGGQVFSAQTSRGGGKISVHGNLKIPPHPPPVYLNTQSDVMCQNGRIGTQNNRITWKITWKVNCNSRHSPPLWCLPLNEVWKLIAIHVRDFVKNIIMSKAKGCYFLFPRYDQYI